MKFFPKNIYDYIKQNRSVLKESSSLTLDGMGRTNKEKYWDRYIVTSFVKYKRKNVESSIYFKPSSEKGKKENTVSNGPPLFGLVNGEIVPLNVEWNYDFSVSSSSDDGIKVTILEPILYDNPVSSDERDKLAKVSINNNYLNGVNSPFYFIPIRYIKKPTLFFTALVKAYSALYDKIKKENPDKSKEEIDELVQNNLETLELAPVLFPSHSKLLTPVDLGLTGVFFTSPEELANKIIESIKIKYEQKSPAFVSYVTNLVKAMLQNEISNFSKSQINFDVKEDFSPSKSDYNFVSKNLGESFAALYFFKNYKEKKIIDDQEQELTVTKVRFPSESNQALYDFEIILSDGSRQLVSVKTNESSGTSFAGSGKKKEAAGEEEKFNVGLLANAGDEISKVDLVATTLKKLSSSESASQKYISLCQLCYPDKYEAFISSLCDLYNKNIDKLPEFVVDNKNNKIVLDKKPISPTEFWNSSVMWFNGLKELYKQNESILQDFYFAVKNSLQINIKEAIQENKIFYNLNYRREPTISFKNFFISSKTKNDLFLEDVESKKSNKTIESIFIFDLKNKVYNTEPVFLFYFLSRCLLVNFNRDVDYLTGLNYVIRSSPNLAFIYVFVACKNKSVMFSVKHSQSDEAFYVFDCNTLVNQPFNRLFSFKVINKNNFKRSNKEAAEIITKVENKLERLWQKQQQI